MRNIVKTLLFLAVILPIITIANGYTSAYSAGDNQTYRHMTADEVPQEQLDAVEKLYKLGLFRHVTENDDGTPNFALNYYTTRIQAYIILIRAIGEEEIAKNNLILTTFQDLATNQHPIAAYALERNMIHGISRTRFNPNEQIRADHFLSAVLSVLGYDCGADFDWCRPWTKTDELNITAQQFSDENNAVSRGEMAVIILNMLTAKLNNQETTLVDKMIENGIFEALNEQNRINSGKLVAAIETEDKEIIKDAVMAIINGTDCDYSHCCCPICCDCGSIFFDRTKQHSQEPIFDRRNDNRQSDRQSDSQNDSQDGSRDGKTTENTMDNSNAVPSNNNTPDRNSNNPGNNSRPNNPPFGNGNNNGNIENSDNAENPVESGNEKEPESGKTECDCDNNSGCGCDENSKCGCDNRSKCDCDSDCGNSDSDKCKCENDCDHDRNGCKCEDDTVSENLCNCDDCENCNPNEDCNGESECDNSDCEKCNLSDECDGDCGDTECLKCEEGDGVDKPGCYGEGDCDCENGCGDTDCPDCNGGDNSAEEKLCGSDDCLCQNCGGSCDCIDEGGTDEPGCCENGECGNCRPADKCGGCADPNCLDCVDLSECDDHSCPICRPDFINRVITYDFTDINFRADVRRLVGKPEGDIFLTDVAHIRVYWVQEGGIADFAGIENFYSLRDFGYGDSGKTVTSLDLSQNVNLRILNMNSQSLETLDLSNNINLEEIGLNGNNLSSLILPDSPNMRMIYVAANRLASIDVSKYPLLERLVIYNNSGLGSLDVTGNLELVELDVTNCGLSSLNLSNNSRLERLSVSSNPLAALDLQSNAALIELFAAGISTMHTLDTSKNTALSWLTVSRSSFGIDLTQNANLTHLIADRSNLSILDLTGNPLLGSLFIQGNSLANIDLSQNIALHTLQCSENELVELVLNNHPKLYHVDVRNNRLAALDLTASADLRFLYTSGNMFSSRDDVTLPDGVNWNGRTIVFGEPSTAYFVTWHDWDGTVLKIEEVEFGGTATPPETPTREGFGFVEWVGVYEYEGFYLIFDDTDIYPFFSPVITNNFVCPAFEAEIRHRISKPAGEILENDVAGITSLIINNKGITSLAGIEHFIALEELDCRDNLLTEADLSKNGRLAYMHCGGNRFPNTDAVTLHRDVSWGPNIVFGNQNP